MFETNNVQLALSAIIASMGIFNQIFDAGRIVQFKIIVLNLSELMFFMCLGLK